MLIEINLLSQWVESYTENLHSWAFHKVSDGELAKDLVQDTFLAAAEKIESFKGDSSPKTWLFSILNHKIIDHYRKKVNQPVRYISAPCEAQGMMEHHITGPDDNAKLKPIAMPGLNR